MLREECRCGVAGKRALRCVPAPHEAARRSGVVRVVHDDHRAQSHPAGRIGIDAQPVVALKGGKDVALQAEPENAFRLGHIPVERLLPFHVAE